MISYSDKTATPQVVVVWVALVAPIQPDLWTMLIEFNYFGRESQEQQAFDFWTIFTETLFFLQHNFRVMKNLLYFCLVSSHSISVMKKAFFKQLSPGKECRAVQGILIFPSPFQHPSPKQGMRCASTISQQSHHTRRRKELGAVFFRSVSSLRRLERHNHAWASRTGFHSGRRTHSSKYTS